MNYVYRNLTKEIEDNIKTRPITYLNGGRQVGKSTLCLNLSDNIDVNQITFDSPIALSSAKSDPATFIASLPDNTLNIIDKKLVRSYYHKLICLIFLCIIIS